MNKLIITALTLLAFSPLAAEEHAADSTASPARQSYRVPEVQVVATKAEMQSEAYRLVSVISHDQIAALPAQTIADILQYLPGLDVRHRGANDAQTDLSMRGGTFDQVQVLLNGVPMNDAQTGHYALNLPVSALLIERIEVLQNGINIVTVSGERSAVGGLTLHLKAGMNAFAHPAVAGSWKAGEWLLNGAAEYARSDGYYAPAPSAREAEALANNGNRRANIYLQARWRELDIQAGAQYKDAGAGLFYGSSTDQFDATRTGFGSVKYKHHWGAWSLQAIAAYRANYDHYEWHRGQTAGSNRHTTHTTTATLQAAYISWLGTTSVALDARHEAIRSTNLGDTSRLHLTYSVLQTFHYDRLNASLSLSGHYNTSFGHHLTGAANIGYDFRPGCAVYLNAQRAMRMPTFTDLYYDAGNQLGNRDLQPEKTWTVSIGGTYAYRGLSLMADAWYRRGTDIIDWVYVPADTKRPYHAMNQQTINSAGTEWTTAYKPDGRLGEWLRMVKVSYAYTWLDLDLREAQSRYLDYLSHKLVCGLEHGIWVSSHLETTGVIAASWTLRWQRREGEYTSAEGVVTPFRPVLLLDGSVYWQNARCKLSVECTNITNRHYYDYGALLMPGAWGTMTMEVRL